MFWFRIFATTLRPMETKNEFRSSVEPFVDWVIHGDPWISADLGGFGENFKKLRFRVGHGLRNEKVFLKIAHNIKIKFSMNQKSIK